MHPISELTCMRLTSSDGPLGEISQHLSRTLDRLVTRSADLLESGDAIDLALFGPLLARSTLEVSTTALVARYDPLRILSIRKAQGMSSYKASSANPIRFEWKGDVLGDKGKALEPQLAPKDLQRAFLCSHVHELVWEEAFQKLLDDVDGPRGAAWIKPLRRLNPQDFTNSMRGEASSLYSELSKGIHNESVIPLQFQFDRATMTSLFDRVWTWVGNMGLTACYSRTMAPASLNAIDAYEEAQRELYS